MGQGGDKCLEVCKETKEVEGIDAAAYKARSVEVLCNVHEDHGALAIQREVGRHGPIYETTPLRSEMHGDSTTEGSMLQRDTQQNEVDETNETCVRELRINGEAARPPQGPQSTQQQPIKFADFVSQLPQAGALAELRGDARTQETLSVLLKGLNEEWSVLYARKPAEEIWRSMPKEVQSRVRMAFDAGNWGVVSSGFPLAQKAEARIMRLRGYGDGIVTPAAEAFVRAYMEISR
jgi:hypothetical protein